jgi:putative membrane protein
MRPLAIRTVVNSVALWVAVRFVPNVTFPAARTFPAGDWWKLLVVALIFGLINAYLKPIVELLSLPARILTLGLFGLVINAVLMLLLALVSDTFSLGFKLATSRRTSVWTRSWRPCSARSSLASSRPSWPISCRIARPGGPHCTCDGVSGEHLRARRMRGSDLEPATPVAQAGSLDALAFGRRPAAAPSPTPEAPA